MILNPTDLGATIVVAPGQIPGGFLPSPDADCLPLVVKLVPYVCARVCACVYVCVGGVGWVGEWVGGYGRGTVWSGPKLGLGLSEKEAADAHMLVRARARTRTRATRAQRQWRRRRQYGAAVLGPVGRAGQRPPPAADYRGGGSRARSRRVTRIRPQRLEAQAFRV